MMIQMMVMVTQEERLLRFVTIIHSAKFLSISTHWWCYDLTEKVLNRESESQLMRMVHRLLQFQQVSKRVTVGSILSQHSWQRKRSTFVTWSVTCDPFLYHSSMWFVVWSHYLGSLKHFCHLKLESFKVYTVSWVQLQYLYIWCRNKAFRHRIKMWGV